MRDLIKKVSPHALSKIHQQYEHVIATEKNSMEKTLKTCDKTFFNIMSLPCAHIIKAAMKTEKKKLLLEDIHPY